MLDFILKGGVFMLPLIICSISALAVIFYLFLRIREKKIIPKNLYGNLNLVVLDPSRLQDENYSKSIIEITRSSKSTLAELSSLLLEGNFSTKAEALESMHSKARERILEMESTISWLEIIFSVSPLFGLLGTASGLVNIFAGISTAGGGSSPMEVAAGISEALNTTIVGLAISAPCVVAHGYFSNKVERLSSRLESIVTRTVHAVANYFDYQKSISEEISQQN